MLIINHGFVNKKSKTTDYLLANLDNTCQKCE